MARGAARRRRSTADVIRRQAARRARPPRTVPFALEIACELEPAEAWARLWDLARHTAAIPFTEVRAPGGGLRAGARFTARTRLGPLGVDDAMRVRSWGPGRRAVIEKSGRPLAGRIEIAVEEADEGCRIVWTQRFGVRGLPRWALLAARPAVRAGYRRALRTILAEPR